MDQGLHWTGGPDTITGRVGSVDIRTKDWTRQVDQRLSREILGQEGISTPINQACCGIGEMS